MGKAGMDMGETYEQEGIVYFKEPYRTDFWTWIDGHIGIDTLFVRNRQALDNDIIYVVAYAKDKSFNAKLSEINKNREDTTLVRGIPEEEVCAIDSVSVQQGKQKL